MAAVIFTIFLPAWLLRTKEYGSKVKPVDPDIIWRKGQRLVKKNREPFHVSTSSYHNYTKLKDGFSAVCQENRMSVSCFGKIGPAML